MERISNQNPSLNYTLDNFESQVIHHFVKIRVWSQCGMPLFKFNIIILTLCLYGINEAKLIHKIDPRLLKRSLPHETHLYGSKLWPSNLQPCIQAIILHTDQICYSKVVRSKVPNLYTNSRESPWINIQPKLVCNQF